MAKLPNNKRLQEHQQQIRGVVNYVVSMSGARRSEIVGASTRRFVADALGDDAYLKKYLGMRRETVRARWRSLLSIASSKPASMGFIPLDDGIRELASLTKSGHSTLFRNLVSWSEPSPPLIEIALTKKVGQQPQVGLINIPSLTEWLLFTSTLRAAKESGQRNAAGFDQIRKLTQLYIAENLPPPSANEIFTWQEAKHLIETIEKVGRPSLRRARFKT
jgi:hypothetical protein